MERYGDYRKLVCLGQHEEMLKEVTNKSIPLYRRLELLVDFETYLEGYYIKEMSELYEGAAEEKITQEYQHKINDKLIETQKLLADKDAAYFALMEELTNHQTHLVKYETLGCEEKVYLKKYFEVKVKPFLIPCIVGELQPFPFVESQEIYAFTLLRTKKGNQKMGIVSCHTGYVHRLVQLPFDRRQYVLVEELILEYLPELFSNYSVECQSLVKVVRSTSQKEKEEMPEETTSFEKAISWIEGQLEPLSILKMEFSKKMNMNAILLICQYLRVEMKQMFYVQSPLNLNFLKSFQEKIYVSSTQKVAN